MQNNSVQNESRIFIGIDVSKDKLAIDSEPPNSAPECCGTYVYSDDHVQFLVQRLSELGDSLALVVIEATGRYEALMAYSLQEAGLRVAVINPRRARKFAEAEGTEAKTDSVDAGVLARFGRAMRPQPTTLPDELSTALRELVSRRRQLISMRDAERHRLSTRLTPTVRNDIVEHINELQKRISVIDKDIDKHIVSNPEWAKLANIITSIPCVGPVLCRTILAELPELGKLDRKQIAKLVGLAPFDRQSGKYIGHKAIWGGRAKLRATLYMATLVGTKRNPVIQSFYIRLLKAGKAKKLALTACMHKLLTILNQMVRTQTCWSHKIVTN